MSSLDDDDVTISKLGISHHDDADSSEKNNENENNTPNNMNGIKLLMVDDVMLNIFEFMDRSFVLRTLSLCSRQFHDLAHQPYHYSRLVWKFSERYYERLNHIKSYYCALRVIEVSDSDRFMEGSIDQVRLLELQSFIEEHRETMKGVELIFNKNQALLFDVIGRVCGEWLSEISINVLLDTEFAKYVCSNLSRFQQLRVLKLLVGKSVDPNVIFDSCGTKIQSMETFETTLYLYNKEHVERFCNCVKSVRNVSFSINCEVLEDDESLMNSVLSCLEMKDKISIHFFNVPSVAFLNQFKKVSTFCREMHISIVDMKNSSSEPLTLSKVHSFQVAYASFIPSLNAFPVDTRLIIFNPSSKFYHTLFTIDKSFCSRYSFLRRIELSFCKLECQHYLENLEFISLTNCSVTSIESVIELSSKLQIVRLVDCETLKPTLTFPNPRKYLRELVLKETDRFKFDNFNLSNFHLSALRDLELHTLYLDRFTYIQDELQYLEDITSLEYLYIYSDKLEIINNFKLDKFVNLKQLFLDTPPSNLITNIFNNPTLLSQAVIALPAGPWYKRPNLTEQQVDSIILSVIEPKGNYEVQLKYTLDNEKFTYFYLQVDTKPAFILFDNELNTIQSWNVFNDTTIPPSFFKRHYNRQTRTISNNTATSPTVTHSQKNCLIL